MASSNFEAPVIEPEALQLPGQLAIEFRDAAVACLSQSPFGAPAKAMVGHAIPPDDCGDIILFYWLRFTPSLPGAGPVPMGTVDVACQGFEWTGEGALFVIRDCATTLGATRGTSLPNRDHKAGPVPEEDMALKLTVDAQLIMCCFAPSIQGIIADTIGVADSCCIGYTPGDLQPFDQGGLAGFGFSFTVAIGACADCVDPV